MELAFGKYISVDKAKQLGVFDACEGLQRNDQGAIDALAPIDVPKVIAGDGASDTDDDQLEPKDSQEELEEPIGEKMAEEQGDNVSLYRAMHHLNKGGLHRALGVKEGEKIPADK